MKFQALSDLHFEFSGEFDLSKTDADVIILAGDMHEGIAGVNWAIRQAQLLGKPVLYVFGNHEYYMHSFPGLMTQAKMITLGTHVHILERNKFIYRNTRILGCTLWSDFGMYGAEKIELCKQVARNSMPDYKVIRRQNGDLLQPEDTIWMFETSLNWLRRELEYPWEGKTVVVTHHAPTGKSNCPKHLNDLLTAAFISNLDSLITHNRINAWIHGHTHYNVDYLIRKTRIISNQRGYPDEEMIGNEFSVDLVFKI